MRHKFMSKPPPSAGGEEPANPADPADPGPCYLPLDEVFGGIGNEKHTMRQLNSRLTAYVQQVKKLSGANRRLEMKIQQTQLSSGLEEEDFEHYYSIIENLHKEFLASTMANARIALEIESQAFALEDFKNKYRAEHKLRQETQADIAQMKRFIDDNTVKYLNLESEVERLTKEIITLKKTHKEERARIRAEINESMVEVKVDGPTQPDLEEIMDEMRAKYEKIIQRNTDEIRRWYQSQLSEMQQQMSLSLKAQKEAKVELKEQHRKEQTMQVQLHSCRGQICALESSLVKAQRQSNEEMESCNKEIVQLEEALASVRDKARDQQERYRALLHLKIKLEEEIENYRRILGEDLFTDQQPPERTEKQREEWERRERKIERGETEIIRRAELEKQIIVEKKLLKIVKEFVGGKLVNQRQEIEQLDSTVESEDVNEVLS
ncbi:keratin, type I cytoskeletal 18-like [Megalops cyprinoides]|uniref:keratin, type I cytoskeletal 18-like n=1 Tax=Megalops cyprinoides TaxID=118141 RepID=UPI0018644B79|nr:keratin, type I cytoskeletal 18-like [Megalops cyprinoides]